MSQTQAEKDREKDEKISNKKSNKEDTKRGKEISRHMNVQEMSSTLSLFIKSTIAGFYELIFCLNSANINAHVRPLFSLRRTYRSAMHRERESYS